MYNYRCPKWSKGKKLPPAHFVWPPQVNIELPKLRSLLISGVVGNGMAMVSETNLQLESLETCNLKYVYCLSFSHKITSEIHSSGLWEGGGIEI